VSVMRTGPDQTVQSTRVLVERCVTDVTDQETTTVNTVSNTHTRMKVELANVTHYGTLNGVTFHTRPATSLAEPVTDLLTPTSAHPASVDSTPLSTDSVVNVTQTVSHVADQLTENAQNATTDGTSAMDRA